MSVDTYFKRWKIGWRKITRDKRCTYEHDDLPSYRRLLQANGNIQDLDHLITVVWKNYRISEKA